MILNKKRRLQEIGEFNSLGLKLCKNLNPLESTVLSYGRIWFSGIEGQKKVQRDFIINLGYVLGYKAAQALDEMCKILTTNPRHKLVFQSLEDFTFTDEEVLFIELVSASVAEDNNSRNLFVEEILSLKSNENLGELAAEFGSAIKTLLTKSLR